MKEKNNRLAMLVRVLSVPPLFAAGLMILLTVLRKDVFLLRDCLWGIGCLTVLPLLAYPLSWLVPKLRQKGRKGQRDLAFVLSGIGYAAVFVYGLLECCSRGAMHIFTTYLFTVLFLIICNKLLHVKASGHASGIAGPTVALGMYLGGIWYMVCAAVYGLTFWASVKTGRHTVREFLAGSLCVLLAIGDAALLYLR